MDLFDSLEIPIQTKTFYCCKCVRAYILPITSLICPECGEDLLEKLETDSSNNSDITDDDNMGGSNNDDIMPDLQDLDTDDDENPHGYQDGAYGFAGNSDRFRVVARVTIASAHNQPEEEWWVNRRYSADRRRRYHIIHQRRARELFPTMVWHNSYNQEEAEDSGSGSPSSQSIRNSPGRSRLESNSLEGLLTIQVTNCQAGLPCCVCYEVLQAGEEVKQLPCLHVYHEVCIAPWLRSHTTCPICRFNMNPFGIRGFRSVGRYRRWEIRFRENTDDEEEEMGNIEIVEVRSSEPVMRPNLLRHIVTSIRNAPPNSTEIMVNSPENDDIEDMESIVLPGTAVTPIDDGDDNEFLENMLDDISDTE